MLSLLNWTHDFQIIFTSCDEHICDHERHSELKN